MTSNDPLYQHTMGQRQSASFMDITIVNRMYGCLDSENAPGEVMYCTYRVIHTLLSVLVWHFQKVYCVWIILFIVLIKKKDPEKSYHYFIPYTVNIYPTKGGRGVVSKDHPSPTHFKLYTCLVTLSLQENIGGFYWNYAEIKDTLSGRQGAIFSKISLEGKNCLVCVLFVKNYWVGSVEILQQYRQACYRKIWRDSQKNLWSRNKMKP